MPSEEAIFANVSCSLSMTVQGYFDAFDVQGSILGSCYTMANGGILQKAGN